MNKKTIITFLLFISFINCKAQSPIIPRFNNGGTFGDVPGAYYKDIDNYLNQFVGTWIYTNGTTSLEIRFIKRTMMFQDNSYYVDDLFGEFRYVENGIEKANTLNALNNNFLTPYEYSLYSITKMFKNSFPKCDECSDNNKRLLMLFKEPANDDSMLSAKLTVRRVDENGVEKIKIQFAMESVASGFKEDGSVSVARSHTIPYGEYTLIKQ